MQLHSLVSINPKKKKRVGRGGNHGTFSGQGCKGQNSRTGGGVKAGFEGGQTPLLRRMPKLHGFKSLDKCTYQVVNVSDLEANFETGAAITKQMLKDARLIPNANRPVKLLGTGEIKKVFELTVDAVSESAKEKVEKAKWTLNIGAIKKEKKEKLAKVEKSKTPPAKKKKAVKVKK